MIRRPSSGYPLAGYSPAESTSVLPKGKILFLRLLSVKRFSVYPPAAGALHLIFGLVRKRFLFHVRAICPAGQYNLLRYVIVSCCNARQIPPQFAGRLAGLQGNRDKYFPALLSCATFLFSHYFEDRKATFLHASFHLSGHTP